MLLFAPLLFPDGRPPSPRWRPVAWLAGATTAAFVVLAAVQPTLELGAGRVANPIGVAAVGNPEDSVPGLVLLDLIGVLVVAAVVALVVRFRRSRGDERLQLKWFTDACALLPLLVLGDGSRTRSPTCCSPWWCRSCRSRPGWRCCATASTRSTG
jgi:hypothetical protein